MKTSTTKYYTFVNGAYCTNMAYNVFCTNTTC